MNLPGLDQRDLWIVYWQREVGLPSAIEHEARTDTLGMLELRDDLARASTVHSIHFHDPNAPGRMRCQLNAGLVVTAARVEVVSQDQIGVGPRSLATRLSPIPHAQRILPGHASLSPVQGGPGLGTTRQELLARVPHGSWGSLPHVFRPGASAIR